MKIDRSFWYTNHVHKSCQRESKVKYITTHPVKSRHKPINKMDLQREIRIALIITARKPLQAETCGMLGPFQTWNFFWVQNNYFSRWK